MKFVVVQGKNKYQLEVSDDGTFEAVKIQIQVRTKCPRPKPRHVCQEVITPFSGNKGGGRNPAVFTETYFQGQRKEGY